MGCAGGGFAGLWESGRDGQMGAEMSVQQFRDGVVEADFSKAIV